MKIDIGSGNKKLNDFISIDKNKNNKPDYIIDLEKDRLPFDDSVIEEVRAHHILEHLGEGFFHCIQEIYRVCQDGAIIDIIFPHHRHDVFYNDPTHKRPITLDGLKLFSKAFNEYCKTIDDSSTPLGIMYDVDLDLIWFDVLYDKHYADLVQQVRNNPEKSQMLDRLIYEKNNVIQEIHAKLLVIK